MIIDNQQQKLDPERIQEWLGNNRQMLTEWLTNIVMVSEVEASASKGIFQCFRAPIRSAPPGGLLDASNELNYAVVMGLVFNRGVMGIPRDGVIGDTAHPYGAEVWKQLPVFSGFYEQHKRLPTQNDSVLITAWHWNYLLVGRGRKNEAVGFMESIISVDFIVDKQVAES